MMTLTTVAKKTSNNSALVYWRVGTKRKGILDVRIDFEHDEADLLAELIAIRYLMFNKQVFSREPISGSGYKLEVSKGAIRKLMQGKSSKKFATKFSTFLTKGRMKGIVIEVSQDMALMPALDECDVELLNAEQQIYTQAQAYYEIDTPAIGKVLVTAHAVNQYQARITSGDPKKPWASLISRLQHPELQIQPFDERTVRHKVRKYGRTDNIEVWGHRDSKFKYLMIIDDDSKKRVLVTVFERNG
ncbi:hypothetical protein [Photorhabdus caribbeanensis]|uniref:hypothetical protein n=1 Tax=Photorhabdus caribbeanensis TaxID=1004165 RepID=UPI001BD50D53|nr:hypothetical protein [Photorhabdus caribbeanensis]MBS9424215.1 hypothetical protein [Photorhabdus caribbeanensis]